MGLVVGFFIVDFPVRLTMKSIPAQYVLGGAIILFGTATGLVPVCGRYSSLMVLRFILGCGEAVLTMGCLYLSQWYKADELACGQLSPNEQALCSNNSLLTTRTAFMYWSTVASFSSGPISYGTDKNLDGVHGIASWKWLFIIESVPTVVGGLAAVVVLPVGTAVVKPKIKQPSLSGIPKQCWVFAVFVSTC
ncbi:hypothetical protein G647_00233 [Cladophialophora carrionii CBS 160.54]|uniref:Major facilitator superfamily (MFS) profile domain-containing protein n=1 Tax=Cladophialophora carrionii CBS 160.54 TaxID=1279043 RepID=V9DLJ7_9EURO|nr:uncharacterized protein G647_00233 [Cladophialophora carrionii CBS 160.54]ETI27784.1 hypothetical protein G647_00233 [Cladophialophora carrionii CBS 160.54]